MKSVWPNAKWLIHGYCGFDEHGDDDGGHDDGEGDSDGDDDLVPEHFLSSNLRA